MTLILVLASATIILTVITLLVLYALWRKKFRRTEGSVSEGESASTTTGQQSRNEDEAVPTDKSPSINNVHWASVYSFDLAVGSDSEEDSESSDDVVKMRRSTLLIHISPYSKSQENEDRSVTK